MCPVYRTGQNIIIHAGYLGGGVEGVGGTVKMGAKKLVEKGEGNVCITSPVFIFLVDLAFSSLFIFVWSFGFLKLS